MKALPRRTAMAGCMLLWACAAWAADTGLQLKPGDHILMYGDSITEQRLYTVAVETLLITRYPAMDLTFHARGVGGDATWGGWLGAADQRVARDVAPFQPNVITIMLGMNDGGYVMPQDPGTVKAFEEGYVKLLDMMHDAAPNARVTLIGTSPYDEVAHPDAQFKGYNDALIAMIDYVKNLAADRGFAFADFNQPVRDFVAAVMAVDPKQAAAIVPDAVHPGPAGHLVMAEALMKAWHVSPVVSDVAIDAATHEVTRQENAVVRDFQALRWKQTDGALPFPITKDTQLAADHSDFQEAMNRQILTVAGLPEGTYRLTIDGQAVTEQRSDAWAKGVNLAAFDTPMRAQAHKVMDLTVLRSNTDFTLWRDVEINLAEYPAGKEAAKALARAVEEIKVRQRKTAQPSEHVYALEALN